MTRKSEIFDLNYERIVTEARSGKAVLIEFKKGEPAVWLPHSQIDLDRDRRIVTVPDWLADKNDLDVDELRATG